MILVFNDFGGLCVWFVNMSQLLHVMLTEKMTNSIAAGKTGCAVLTETNILKTISKTILTTRYYYPTNKM